MAKAALGDCQKLATRDGLQLHGAIGFTWEHDLHFLLKRATTTAFLLGNAESHRVDLAGLLGLAA
jgi:alkylation response protein AidB-like acyl-CoA dehydrogenase